MLHNRLFIFLFTFILINSGFAAPYLFKEKLVWSSIQKITVDEHFTLERLSFEGANFNDFNPLPHFNAMYPIHSENVKLDVKLSNKIIIDATENEIALLKEIEVDTSFLVFAKLAMSRKEPFVYVDIMPLRWNSKKQKFEKLVSFDILLEVEDQANSYYKEKTARENSVLADGNWYKVKVSKSGVYKISYQDLEAIGFDVSGDPRNIAVYGNGGGILPEQNNLFRHDDLVENPIIVTGESDGKFDQGDYILFYGEGPVVWNYNVSNDMFEHQTNYYDDYTYYFVTASKGPGKRLQNISEPSEPPGTQVTTFTDYEVHEVDERNLGGTGRIWYGEVFDFNATQEFDFEFSNIIQGSESANFYGDFASIAESANLFEIYINDVLEKTLAMSTIASTDSYTIAKYKNALFDFTPTSDKINVKLIYKRSSSSSSGYLDFFRLNVKRQLRMSGNQMKFRRSPGVDDDQVVKYILSNANNDITIWDVTNPVNVRQVNTSLNSGNLEFNSTTDSVRQFIAFNGNEYYAVEFEEKVENQNLHAVTNIDYLIITHPDFIAEAQQLALYHTEATGLHVYITTPDLIYNEFSSGSQDITGIRDFVKYIYDNSEPGNELQYLLLFGDASFDYKEITSGNTNLVPCWEDINSWNIVNSIATDDYYAFLDDGEGIIGSTSDKVDIGIGRFVVATLEEAQMAVNKTIHYATNTTEVMGPWRNLINFVADDGDNNRHLNDAEWLSGFLEENYPVYNINKIYLDAYTQVPTPGGQRAPDVNRAINNQMAKGALIMNYSGHGGEVGWGHERYLETTDINSWTNYNKMPIFITATCEFSRYDDPRRTSAGELVFLNENGGGIALFTTARATFASSNLQLNTAIYNDNLFEKSNGNYPRFGDVIRQSKASGAGNSNNNKKFILIGDPALRLAYPEFNVETIKINGQICVEDVSDTLVALAQITIEGLVTDEDDSQILDFNGVVYPTIYDKFSEIVTLGDESASTTFELRQNVLFNGKASVTNGEFKVEFIVPKDIAYKYGRGRISYYVNSDDRDGHGYYENIIIGGYNKNALEDNEGPIVELFMNDLSFISGGTTNENPVLLALVSDETGINTTGNGIGHDILASIDGEDNVSYNLNQYYEADINSYNSGTISYPFQNLSDGNHTLSLRVWDIYNNSTTAYLDFVVVSSTNMVVENLMNYPNPFIDQTSFVFDHNQSGQELDVQIQIFTSSGQVVKTFETQMTPEGFQSEPITWDGTSDSGGRVGRGFLICRLVVRNETGATQEEHTKLLYVR